MQASAAVTPLRSAPTPIGNLTLGAVRLVVRDLAASTAFWKHVIGLVDLGRDGTIQRLGAGETPLVELAHDPHAVPPAHTTTGLFHVALLVPGRADLARCLRRIIDRGWQLTGAADHLVSEALYLDDNEGNGIELYRDRPRTEWAWAGDGLVMDTLRLDLDALLGEVPETEDEPVDIMPPHTTVGHVHLKVSDLAESEHWYRTVIGLDTTTMFPTASFMSGMGYHHHLGMNTWTTLAGPAQQPDQLGLAFYTMQLPAGDRRQLLERLDHSGTPVFEIDGAPTVRDPSGIAIRIS